MLKKSVLGALLMGVCSQSMAALSMQPMSLFGVSLRPFTVATAGVDFMRAGESQSLTLIPPLSNYYVNHASYASSGSFGLGAGVEAHPSERYFWQLGVAGFYNTPITSSGDVLQFGSSAFNNFSYRYRIQSYRFVAMGKLLSTYKQIFHPYLSGELGAAINVASAYHETASIHEAVPMAAFKNNTQTSFAWGVGAGVDVDVNPCFRLGVGYQFVDLGEASLGVSPAQVTNQQITISNLYDHQVHAQLTALF